MKRTAMTAGRAGRGTATLLGALAWLAGSGAADAGVNAWTPFGPEGTSVTVLAIDPADPSTLYASTPRGLYKSASVGGVWSRILDNPNVTALAIDPQASTTLYAGTAHVSQNLPESIGAGILKSTDGGATWRGINTGLPTVSGQGVVTIRGLVIDPRTPTTLYAVVGDRAFRSTDGGGSWTGIGSGLTNPYVTALAIDPQTPNILYAGTGNGVSRSTDGGAGWVAVGDPLPAAPFSFLRVDPVTPTTLYAGTFKDARDAAGAVLFKSTDSGARWVTIGNGLPDATHLWYVSDLAIDPAAPGTIYAALSSRFSVGSGGIFKSTDGGGSWAALDTGLLGRFIAALAIDPRTPSTLYAGSLGDGVFKSTDGGGVWRAVNTGLPRTTTGCLIVAPGAPATHYAVTSARLGSASASALHKSVDRGATWSLVGPISGCPRIDPRTPTTMYLPGSNGVLKSTDGGVSWSFFSIGLDPSYHSTVTHLTIDPQTPTTLYAAAWRYSSWSMQDRFSEGVFRSTDGGETWSRLGVGTGFCSGCDHWMVTSLVIDPATPTTVYVANNLYVARSTDGGASWTGCGSLNLYYYWVGGLAIDPLTPGTLYTTTTDGILKSTDGCRTWSVVTGGLPSEPDRYGGSRRWYSVSIPTIDPDTPDTLYVSAGRDGLFKSTDGGASWNHFDPGPPSYLSRVVLEPLDPSILYAVTTAGVYKLEQRPNRRPVADADASGNATSARGARVD